MKIGLIFMINSTILYFVEAKLPFSKRRQATWRLECELGMITDSECPVDGGWSPWAPWSACHGPCDDVGHRKRQRKCINPPASQDGLPCKGLDEEIEPCYLTNCSVDDYRKLVKGDSARSEALSQLEAVPKVMDKCLNTECTFKVIETCLASDNTWQINPVVLWNNLLCVKHDIGCPIMGEWGVWGTWSECGARCGKGSRWRLRKCDTPPPSASHLVCLDSPLQYEECEGDQCEIDKRYSESARSGTWSDWSAWSECSERCGSGVRRRKRTCIQKQTSPASVPWGTHCQGQYYQLEVCSDKNCLLNGGWSGWSPWGPCSQTCGAGKRSRSRSCTRPIPLGTGATCTGPTNEVSACFLKPCDVFAHDIAIFDGDSHIMYNFDCKRSTFFHFYVRFMPLSPHGTLVRRGCFQDPRIRLSLHKWHVCLDSSGTSKLCRLPRLCSPTAIEPAAWYSLLLTVTNEAVTIRINDIQSPINVRFPCDPELKEEPVNIVIGEKFHGEVQEVIVNFIPLSLFIQHEHQALRSHFIPSSISNIIYDKSDMKEAFLNVKNEQYIRKPCFEEQEEWSLELTFKSEREQGILLFLQGDNNYWFLVILQNLRIKMKIQNEDYRSEMSSSTEYFSGHWIHVSISKKRESNAIQVIINYDELLHIYLSDETERNARASQKKYNLFHNNCSIFEIFKKPEMKRKVNQTFAKVICRNEMYVGGVPKYLMQILNDEVTFFSGIIASIKLNSRFIDLRTLTIESEKDNVLHLSSRAASVSGMYHEIGWGQSNKINLTCIYALPKKSLETAQWFFLDTALSKTVKNASLRPTDKNKVIKLVVAADVDQQGFYTCRAYLDNGQNNIVTYGVLGKMKYKLAGPDMTTVIAVFTTVSLVIFTVGWLLVEVYYDFRDGYGFFRDIRLSSEEGANDSDKLLEMGKDSDDTSLDFKIRKRVKSRYLSGRANFALKKSDGCMDMVKELTLEGSDEENTSNLATLPPLPSDKRCGLDLQVSHAVYRCETSCSSPRHDSNITRPKLTSSSSIQNSPKVLCSRRVCYTKKHPCCKSQLARRKSHQENCSEFNDKSNLFTIQSSTCVKSPAKRILQKFKDLKGDEI